MRNTIQSELIFNIVVNSDNHFTAEEIYDECIKFKNDISLGTVYRNLNKLVIQKKIKRIKMPDNIDRYDKNNIHAHAICSVCGSILDVFSNYIKKTPVIENFKISDYDLVFNGICKKCQKEER